MKSIERIILKLVVIQFCLLIFVQAFFNGSEPYIHLNKLYKYEGVAGTAEQPQVKVFQKSEKQSDIFTEKDVPTDRTLHFMVK